MRSSVQEEIYVSHYRREYEWSYYAKVYGDFRSGKKYRKSADHERKDREEDPWREKKLRDHRRRNPYYRFSKKWYKKFRNQSHRQWVKKNLDNERFDAFHDQEMLAFCDRYYWD